MAFLFDGRGMDENPRVRKFALSAFQWRLTCEAGYVVTTTGSPVDFRLDARPPRAAVRYRAACGEECLDRPQGETDTFSPWRIAITRTAFLFGKVARMKIRRLDKYTIRSETL